MLSGFSIACCLSLFISQPVWAEKIYVVERERSELAVIEDGVFKSKIKDLGKMHHATLKFFGDFAYIISRDGILSKIDTQTDTVVKQVKAGNSGIGFTFVGQDIAVANYDPHTVSIFNQNLEPVTTVETGSRNVGIKAYQNYLIFSLMDKDQIWVLDANKKYQVIKKIEQAGAMPFDALIHQDTYMAGFYKEPGVGILRLSDMSYHKEAIMGPEKKPILKIPHFGLWGVLEQSAYIPGTGQAQINVVDLKQMSFQKQIDLPGFPVFVSRSPDQKHLAVNYSGDTENVLSYFSVADPQNIKHLDIGKRIMHLRYSLDGKKIYFSSYFDNRVKAIDTETGEVVLSVPVANPSGIFIKAE